MLPLDSPSPRRVLVTGAAGFIGSHLVDRLLADGWTVTGMDNFDPFYGEHAKRSNLANALTNPRFRLVEADIRDASALQNGLPEAFDVIVHLAAKAGVRPSIADPSAYQEVNVGGTQVLLELARERGIEQFVFASSSSVYGVDPDVPWREDAASLQPISPYAATKVAGELLGHVYAHLYGLRFIALRFFTVYGPRQRPDLAIHKFARRMIAGEPIPVYGDGSTRRDYTFVADTVQGIVSAMHYDASSYAVVNLGNDRTVSLADLIASLERALGVGAIIDRQSEQPGDVPQTWASLDKARTLLGYAPQTSLDDGLATFATWLRTQPDFAPSAA
ncbi:MAG: GDP-mannose 4,6-dehydratase [Rubricoccaceae bacterium]